MFVIIDGLKVVGVICNFYQITGRNPCFHSSILIENVQVIDNHKKYYLFNSFQSLSECWLAYSRLSLLHELQVEAPAKVDISIPQALSATERAQRSSGTNMNMLSFPHPGLLGASESSMGERGDLV
jgi:hypothetical protein